MIATNRTSKVVTMMMILTMIFTMGYGQGRLIEGASKIFQSLVIKEAQTEFVAINADFSTVVEEEKDSFRINAVLNVFERKNRHADHSSVIASFTVKNIDIAYEEELATENWMETSLAEEIETVPAVENWMTESFAAEIEATPAVENWMTESFENGIEQVVEVEAWMTTPLEENIEEAIVTEAWMTTPLNQDFESEVFAEKWMTQPLYENSSLEQTIETEDWMTTPLYVSAMEVITVESWMTESLR